jgi:hypothetical protein
MIEKIAVLDLGNDAPFPNAWKPIYKTVTVDEAGDRHDVEVFFNPLTLQFKARKS